MILLPTLYKLTSTGKIQAWEISTNGAFIHTTYGLLDGKMQHAEEEIKEGKNLGKTNETTTFEQAELEAKSQWEKKVKKGYVQNVEDAQNKVIDTNFITGGVEPMLAHKYEDQGHKIHYPAYVQPKLDGHRCIAIVRDGKCTLWSRTRKPILSMPHIQRALEQMYRSENIVLDGELYNHDYRDHFEDLTSLIRQSKPMPGHEVVQYWVYDVVIDAPFSKRFVYVDDVNTRATMAGIENTVSGLIAFWPESEEEMIAMFGAFLENGYEGLMVRNADGVYKNKRSYDLQKVKVMADDEFEVIDVTEGKGKMAGKAMFHCLVPCEQCNGVGDYPPHTRQVCSLCHRKRGKEFRVKMVGTLDSLAHYLDHKEDYIGKMLTIKYQNLSADGIPRFPIALRFRKDV